MANEIDESETFTFTIPRVRHGAFFRVKSNSQMHRCLAIPEILYTICEIVRGEVGWQWRKTLAALARTCRLFQEPALDNLWYELRDLCPLVKCLPREAWKSAHPAGWGPLGFSRGLTPSDSRTIREYSQRVRIIHITGDYAGLEASSLQSLDFLPGPLFPNLRQLTWSHVPEEYFSHIRLFLNKKLVSVNISLGELQAAQATFINLMPSLIFPPILRCLRIKIEGELDRARSIHFLPISTDHNWSALRTLSIPGATVTDIVQIGDLPNLHKLTLRDQFIWDENAQSSIAGSFPSLGSLELEGHPARITRRLLLFRNAELVELFIHSPTGEQICSDEQWRELFINVSENVNHDSLQTLGIQFCNIPIPTLEASDILPPLLCFNELRSFSISFKRSLALSHDETLELTKSWPKITTVHFTPESFEPDHCSKLSSLALWAKNCPKLEDLHLSVDASDRDDRLDLLSRLVTPEFNAIHSPLSALNVGNSPIIHKEFVALFLLKIFPNLKRIHDTQSERRRWEKVVLLMSLMKASRSISGKDLQEHIMHLRHRWVDRSHGYGDRAASDEESDG